jgi:hypothetical protein
VPRQGFYTRPTCPDCGGAEFRTIKGTYVHSRECPRRQAELKAQRGKWQSDAEQDRQELDARQVCQHGCEDWTTCAACTWMADFGDDEYISGAGALW